MLIINYKLLMLIINVNYINYINYNLNYTS
jgi:hypothetical protein